LDRAEHLAKAQAFERFRAKLDPNDPDSRNWIITASYYAALHYIDIYLASKGYVIITNHDERRRLVDRLLRGLYATYRKLENLSWQARYENLQPEPNDLETAGRLFDRIKTEIRTLLRI